MLLKEIRVLLKNIKNRSKRQKYLNSKKTISIMSLILPIHLINQLKEETDVSKENSNKNTEL